MKKLIENVKPKCECFICTDLANDDITIKLKDIYYEHLQNSSDVFMLKDENELGQYPRYKHETFMKIYQCQDLL